MSLITSAQRGFNSAKEAFFPSMRTYLKNRAKPLYRGMCLYEAGRGLNINGNMFVLAREMSANARFSGLRGVFVVTQDTADPARERLRIYGMDMPVVYRDSQDYQRYLARCEFLFTDNSFPAYFHKRENQTYVNTWHGTPLKQLGRSNIQSSLRSLANVQKNLLSADYLVFPNELTKSCFFDDYMIGKLFAGRYCMADYPRNDSLTDDAIRSHVRTEQSLTGKHVLAYMPTWRGAGRRVDSDEQKAALKDILCRLDACLSGDDVLFVNLHFLLGDVLDYDAYEHIRRFPSEYETYDFLAACDVLITDYSSVFFDFAVTRRKIVLFPYDLDEYLADTGTYVPYDSLPFPQATTVEELVRLATERSYETYDEFIDTYCAHHTGHASEDLLATVCLGEAGLTPHGNECHEPVRLAYVKTMGNQVACETVLAEMASSWPNNGVLAFMGRYWSSTLDFLDRLPDGTDLLALTTIRNMTGFQRLVAGVANRIPLVERAMHKRLLSWNRKELDRLIPGVSVESVLSYLPSDDYMLLILGAYDCEKKAILRESTLIYSRSKKIRAVLRAAGYELVESEHRLSGNSSAYARETYYNRSSNARLLTRHDALSRDELGLHGLMLVHMPAQLDAHKLEIVLGDGRVVGQVFPLLVRGITSVHRYDIRLSLAEARTLEATNTLYLRYMDETGHGMRIRMRYNRIDGRHGGHKRRRPLTDEATGTTLCFQQGEKNFLILTERGSHDEDHAR